MRNRSNEDVVFGLDLGTTGAKILVVNPEGEIVAKFGRSLRLFSKKPGWAEQEPQDWWCATLELMREAVSFCKDKGLKPRAMSTSGQMHSLVAVDRDGEVLRSSILWCDQRSADEASELMERLGGVESTIRLLGNPVLPGFTAGKIRWLEKHEPEVRSKIHRIMLPKDYVNFKLTGQFKTEHSDASGTAMYDVSKRTWAAQALEALSLSPDQLPEIVESNGVIGTVAEEVATDVGLGPSEACEFLVVAGGADNACAALGLGVTEENRGMLSLGTSGTVLVPTKVVEPDLTGRVHLFSHVLKDTFYYMGVMLSATLTFDWFRDLLGDADFDIINQKVSETRPGADGVLVLPYLNGERTPHNDPNARAVIFGLSASHGKWHIYRAVLEAVAYGLRDCYEALPRTEVSELRVTGGGFKSRVWSEIVASVFNRQLTHVNSTEGAAYGAAILAYSAFSGENPSDVANEWVKVVRRTSPNADQSRETYEEGFRRYRRLYQVLRSLQEH